MIEMEFECQKCGSEIGYILRDDDQYRCIHCHKPLTKEQTEEIYQKQAHEENQWKQHAYEEKREGKAKRQKGVMKNEL